MSSRQRGPEARRVDDVGARGCANDHAGGQHPACEDGPVSSSAVQVSLVPMRLGPHGADVPALAEFLSSHTFPFHIGRSYTRQEAEASAASDRWSNQETRSYWVVVDGEHVGIASLDDLQDDTPMFDLRLADAHRGRGLGVPVLKALTSEVFRLKPEARRFEGQTREDNLAMRAVFLRAGWVKEAMYREGWGEHTSVAYAILRRDWESGTTTPLVWDEPAAILPR